MSDIRPSYSLGLILNTARATAMSEGSLMFKKLLLHCESCFATAPRAEGASVCEIGPASGVDRLTTFYKMPKGPSVLLAGRKLGYSTD
jgi:hypothetical protein